MKYKIVHTRETDNYTRYLEELSEKGFRVISAGMTANPALKCFDWWAVLEETPVDIELKKPEDDAAELLEAAREIAKYCARINGCFECPFASQINGLCVVRGIPADWRIIKEG